MERPAEPESRLKHPFPSTPFGELGRALTERSRSQRGPKVAGTMGKAFPVNRACQTSANARFMEIHGFGGPNPDLSARFFCS